jgi:hypothetical protein
MTKQEWLDWGAGAPERERARLAYEAALIAEWIAVANLKAAHKARCWAQAQYRALRPKI